MPQFCFIAVANYSFELRLVFITALTRNRLVRNFQKLITTNGKRLMNILHPSFSLTSLKEGTCGMNSRVLLKVVTAVTDLK